jgi:hypothetical protein
VPIIEGGGRGTGQRRIDRDAAISQGKLGSRENESMVRRRLSIRGMSLGVAIIGTILGVLIERHRRFQGLAEYHAVRAGGMSGIIYNFGHPSDSDLFWFHVRFRHDCLAEKYRKAARQPWWPVRADPLPIRFEVGEAARSYEEMLAAFDSAPPTPTPAEVPKNQRD